MRDENSGSYIFLQFTVWAGVLIAAVVPAFPSYGWWFWLLTFLCPPLVLIPIVEAVSR